MAASGREYPTAWVSAPWTDMVFAPCKHDGRRLKIFQRQTDEHHGQTLYHCTICGAERIHQWATIFARD